MNNLSKLAQRFSRHVKVFSFSYALEEVFAVIDRYMSEKFNRPVSTKILKKKEKYILNWLIKFFNDEINSFQHRQDRADTKRSNEKATIWMCWLQGEENAPLIVKQSIKRVKALAGSHEVVVLDELKVKEYCHIPELIWEKYHSGLIVPQQFADIVRANLLAQRGGLWIDSTVLLLRRIPEEIFTLPTYSVKNISTKFKGYGLVCDADKWQCYFIESCSESATYSFISKCLNKYWIKYDTLIDYFLISYIAKIAREMIPKASEEYSFIPSNNFKCELLSDYLSCGGIDSQDCREYFFKNDTWLYKLSWKSNYPNSSAKGKTILLDYVKKVIVSEEET